MLWKSVGWINKRGFDRGRGSLEIAELSQGKRRVDGCGGGVASKRMTHPFKLGFRFVRFPGLMQHGPAFHEVICYPNDSHALCWKYALGSAGLVAGVLNMSYNFV